MTIVLLVGRKIFSLLEGMKIIDTFINLNIFHVIVF